MEIKFLIKLLLASINARQYNHSYMVLAFFAKSSIKTPASLAVVGFLREDAEYIHIYMNIHIKARIENCVISRHYAIFLRQ